jgi:choline dehydrogenase-like flavoprotein
VKSAAEFDRLCTDDVPAQALTLYASHPMSTCRMGADAKTAVVAPSGETHDVRNLYVADASIFPTALGVNPQISVMSSAITLARAAVKS